VALDDYFKPGPGLGVAGNAALAWNGRVWQIVPSPYPLVDVSCLHGVALTGCTYLSYSGASRGVVSFDTLSDGPGGWARLGIHGSAPVKANPDNYAYTCSSRSSCMTVGSIVRPVPSRTAYIKPYAAHWNGGRWSRTMPPSPPPASPEGGDNVLNGVRLPDPARLPGGRHRHVQGSDRDLERFALDGATPRLSL
jgi:hypothetical protein